MEIQSLILWYLALMMCSVIGFPLAHHLFEKWFDNGWTFARYIGLVIVAMPLWFFSSIRILPFNQVFIVLSVVIALAVSLYFWYKLKLKVTKQMLLTEVIFAVMVFFWMWVRSYNPDINGTEKFMNIAIMNSIFRSEYFPPQDMWYQGETLNYYYIGHYLYVFITKFLGLETSFTYNFGLVSIISQLFASLFTLFITLFNKGNKIRNGVLALILATWISFGGNLHYVVNWLVSVIQGEPFNYFYPEATRIIPFTINEFPAYSIVLGDLHPHYLVIPFLVIGLSLAYVAYTKSIKTKDRIMFNALISPFIVILYGINSWDFITVMFVFALIQLYQAYKEGDTPMEQIELFAKAELALLLPGLLLMLPYFVNFSPAVGGAGLVPFDVKSPIDQWLLMWGAFLVISILFSLFFFTKRFKKDNNTIFAIMFMVAAFCLIFGVEFIFLKDIFFESNNDYFRTNTVFKFYYHAWIIWGIAAGWFTYAIVNLTKKRSQLLSQVAFGVISVVLASSIIYIYKAVDDFYPIKRAFDNTAVPLQEGEVTMDGLRFMKLYHVPDYDAVQWINSHIDGQPIMMEAVGDAYTYYARVSAFTGVQTVVGWPTHEWQWRGDPTPVFKRSDDVKLMYETQNKDELTELVDLYNVEYIYVGSSEIEKYENLNTSLFRELYTVVYEESGVTIYSTADSQQ